MCKKSESYGTACLCPPASLTGRTIDIEGFFVKVRSLVKQEPELRFKDMLQVVADHDLLMAAYRSIRRSNATPGVDGQTFQSVESWGLGLWLGLIHDDIAEKRYFPRPVRPFAKKKEDGSSRPLAVATIRDRVVQTAIRMVLESIFEPGFSENSFAYRKGKSTRDALEAAIAAIRSGKVVAYDIDVRKCFERIPHDVVRRLLARRVADPSLLDLIGSFLSRAGDRGILQGDPLSPLLSNVVLHEFDLVVERLAGDSDAVHHVRYADDAVVLLHPDREIEDRLREGVDRVLASIGLELNIDKTSLLDLAEGRHLDFLGYRLSLRNGEVRVQPRAKAVVRLQNRLVALLRRRGKKHWRTLAAEAGELISGWATYYEGCDLSAAKALLRRRLRTELGITRRKHLELAIAVESGVARLEDRTRRPLRMAG